MARKNKLFDGSREFQICFAVYKKYFQAFKNDYYDILMAGYVAILELSKKYDISNRNLCDKQIGSYYFNFAHYGMSKYASKVNIKDVSLSLPIGNDIYLADVLEDVSFDLYDNSKIILSEFFKLLKSYDLQKQDILEDYILNNLSMSDIYKKYKFNKFKLCNLVREFRLRLFEILKADNLLKNLFISPDEFTKFEREKERIKNKNNGVATSGNYEYKIYKLLKDFSPVDISRFLGIEQKSFERILNCYHDTTKAKKLYLWQIQKLRLQYFKNYSLEQLVAVGG